MKLQKDKLRLIAIDEIDKPDKYYYVEFPKRLSGNECSKVKIKFIQNEYQYSVTNNIFTSRRFCSEELRAIADKLDELNGETK